MLANLSQECIFWELLGIVYNTSSIYISIYLPADQSDLHAGFAR